MPLPLLPPAFSLIALDREVAAFARAVRAAPRGVDDGTVYWTDRGDRLELAVVLEPEGPVGTTLEAIYVLTVAAGDALGALLPPVMPLAFAWPGEIILDGARLGRVQAAMAPVSGTEAVPPWLVLGLTVRIASVDPEPGRMPDRTSLQDIGAGDVTSVQLAETVARYFLTWTGRWLEEGLAPVRAAWNERCFRRGEESTLTAGGEAFSGRIRGLDETGAFIVGDVPLRLERVLDELG